MGVDGCFAWVVMYGSLGRDWIGDEGRDGLVSVKVGVCMLESRCRWVIEDACTCSSLLENGIQILWDMSKDHLLEIQ